MTNETSATEHLRDTLQGLLGNLPTLEGLSPDQMRSMLKHELYAALLGAPRTTDMLHRLCGVVDTLVALATEPTPPAAPHDRSSRIRAFFTATTGRQSHDDLSRETATRLASTDRGKVVIGVNISLSAYGSSVPSVLSKECRAALPRRMSSVPQTIKIGRRTTERPHSDVMRDYVELFIEQLYSDANEGE